MSQQAIPLPQTAPSTPAPFNWGKFFSLDNKYIAPAFITTILIVGHLSFGMLESYKKTGVAILASLITELILSKIFMGKWPILASAYVSGISVGILVRSPAFWPYVVCAVVAIMSKYVLRVNGRHIWNPSNFSISVLLFLAPEVVATLSIQWGNYLLPMLVIWCLGSVIIARLKRFNITGTYVACFIILAFVRSAITGSPWQSEIAPLTGPMYQLFIFFMITDPKTTVRSRKWQSIVVAIVAIVETILRLNQIVYAPFYALFLVGPTALMIEDYVTGKFKKPAPAQTPQPARA
jgi:Na+-transporting NADH:ubiquinone oxidoreductase subunit NqrB